MTSPSRARYPRGADPQDGVSSTLIRFLPPHVAGLDHDRTHNDGDQEVSGNRDILTRRTQATAQTTAAHSEISDEDLGRLVRAILRRGVELDGAADHPAESPRPLTEDELAGFRRYLTSHANRGKGLSDRTIRETLKCVRQLEHPEDSQFSGRLPPAVPCWNPSEEDWLERKEFEMDVWDGSGTNNRRKALRHIIAWQDLPVWDTLEGTIPPANRRRLPVPPRKVVPQIYAKRENATYRDNLFRHITFFCFHAGWRISEIRDLRVSDVDLENDYVGYWSTKDGEEKAPKPYEPFLVSATNGPTLRHYLEHVRPDPQPGHEDVFFLTAEGEQWSYNGLRTKLSAWGKEAWPPFYPHCMRKFAAVEFLAANDFNILAAAQRLGDEIDTVREHYLPAARVRSEMGTKFRMPRFRGDSS